jgi:hypothetical protein
LDTLFVFFDERKTIFEECVYSYAAKDLLEKSGITQDSQNPFVFHFSARFFSDRNNGKVPPNGREITYGELDDPFTSIRLAVGPIDKELISVYGIHVDSEKLDHEAVEQINEAISKPNSEDIVLLKADSESDHFRFYIDEYLKHVQRLLPYTGYAE